MTPFASDEFPLSRIRRREFFRMALISAPCLAFADPPLTCSNSSRPGLQGRSLLIRGGTAVTDERTWEADIRVRGGRIVEIGGKLETAGEDRVVEARGLQVLPGGIDPHAHLTTPWVDDYLSGSRAALAGGITTIGCMVHVQQGERLLQAINRESGLVQDQAIADFVLHPILGAPTEDLPDQVRELAGAG
ncbi:MAG: hypothetical protein ABIG68_00615, partial [Acidobacteriota bacterium]